MLVKKKGLLVWMILFICSLLLTGCNDAVVIKDLQIDSKFYHQTGYLLGNDRVKLKIELDKELNQDLTYYWKATGGRFLTQGKQEVTYITPKLPGDYSLKLVIKKENQVATTFKFPFVVKGNYPKRVKLNKVVINSLKSGVKLDWSAYKGTDFYSYKILRSNNFYIDDQAQVIANITNQAQDYYTDDNIEPNQVYSYQIMVINHSGYLSASNEEMIRGLPQGVRKQRIKEEISQIVVDDIHLKSYITVRDKRQILVLNNNGKIVKQINLGIYPKEAVLALENKYLFVLSLRGNSIVRIDLESLEKKKYKLNIRMKDITSSGDYLYLLPKSKRKLIRFAIKKGKIKNNFSIKFKGKRIKARRIRVINNEYLIADMVFGPTLFYNLKNLSKPIKKLDIGPIKDIAVSIAGSQYYIYLGSIGNRIIQSYLINSDDKIIEQQGFVVNSYPRDLLIKGNSLFVGYDSKKITIFDLKKDKLSQKIKLNNYIYDLGLSKKSKRLYLITAAIDKTNSYLTIIDLKKFN
ncbi:hypothetical protein Halha_1517 [Halobacteroides halobius DSM 5150]|uniref:Fibronectin type-III domain-containing protein n=1 Tax=Halobacteroides halobius (strain ATCC 35273 / DSM 5150 / MD-1) TaxID=748449 RepID=L0KBJ2_HALHC|nr:hypothetical protein [Halobacteroides halobius]AGB41458.1 hypothetical protein Halha_1517 [Halobacteroides halobius DSM 5150]